MLRILYLFYVVYLVLVISLVFLGRKKPMQRFSWILILVFVPVVGLVFYQLLGSERYWDEKKKKIRLRHKGMFQHLGRIARKVDQSEQAILSSAQLFHKKYCGSALTLDNEVEFFTNGEGKFAKLFQDLEAAQDHIHIQYFTIHNDTIGKKTIEILRQKAREGVEVKLLYDTFGCLFTFVRTLFWELKQDGGLVKGVRPYARALNYRNHRKLVIIDGKIGYLGGMNIGEHYQYGVRGMYWRDSHLRLTGSSVLDLQQVFISDWIASARRGKIGFTRKLNHYFPAIKGKGELPVQVVASGLYDRDIPEDVIGLSYFNLINQAEHTLWIQTPYFSPTESVLQSLKTLALRGVDVRIMTSAFYAFGGLFHHNIANYYLRQLVGSGIRVFKYNAIMHAKTMTIDEKSLVVGTVNFNVRSLEKDDELFVYLESERENAIYRRIFEEDLKQSVELDYVRFRKETLLSRVLESVVSLFSPFS